MKRPVSKEDSEAIAKAFGPSAMRVLYNASSLNRVRVFNGCGRGACKA